MSKLTVPKSPRSRQGGMSLVEVLIGMLIAMVGVIIMMEVLLTSEQRTRTTGSGNDALGSGAVMLHMMQRDLVQAGYGINSIGILGCNLTLPNGAVVPLAPVVINPPAALIPAGDASTDTMLVFYGSDAGQPEGNAVQSVSGNDYTMQSPSSFSVGDYVVAYPNGCGVGLTLAQVTAISALAVTVDNPVAGATILYNMGRTPRIVAYAVRNGALNSCDFMASDCRVASAANWTAVAGGIVSLRAQYGRDTAAPGAMDGVVDLWDQTTPTNSCEWARASAVRFALVARAGQYETKVDAGTGQRVCDQVTTTARTWSGSTGASTAPINLTAAADWQCYRYKTFENVAPTRNVVWMGTQTGC